MIPENLPYVYRHHFDSADLDMLEQAFESVWATISNHDPSRTLADEEEAKAGLRRMLFALASQGVKDPQTLRNLALRDSPLRNVLLARESERPDVDGVSGEASP